MRISDWSSDVCSSDLIPDACQCYRLAAGGGGRQMRGFESRRFQRNTFGTVLLLAQGEDVLHPIVIGRSAGHDPAQGIALPKRADRKSVVEGKSVSVRVDLGGRRLIKKQKIKSQ